VVYPGRRGVTSSTVVSQGSRTRHAQSPSLCNIKRRLDSFTCRARFKADARTPASLPLTSGPLTCARQPAVCLQQEALSDQQVCLRPPPRSRFPWQSTALANFEICAERLEISNPPFDDDDEFPTRRLIARTTFTMAAVYENLSSDLVWQISRTLPTTENTPARKCCSERYIWSRDGMEGEKCYDVLCCAL